MKTLSTRVILLIVVSLTIMCCDDQIKNEQARPVLIKAEQISRDSYLIVCAGFPKAGLVNDVQRVETAKEAALLNAQVIARQRFEESFDVVTNGSIQKYLVKDEYVEVYYLITQKNIARYLRK